MACLDMDGLLNVWKISFHVRSVCIAIYVRNKLMIASKTNKFNLHKFYLVRHFQPHIYKPIEVEFGLIVGWIYASILHKMQSKMSNAFYKTVTQCLTTGFPLAFLLFLLVFCYQQFVLYKTYLCIHFLNVYILSIWTQVVHIIPRMDGNNFLWAETHILLCRCFHSMFHVNIESLC